MTAADRQFHSTPSSARPSLGLPRAGPRHPAHSVHGGRWRRRHGPGTSSLGPSASRRRSRPRITNVAAAAAAAARARCALRVRTCVDASVRPRARCLPSLAHPLPRLGTPSSTALCRPHCADTRRRQSLGRCRFSPNFDR